MKWKDVVVGAASALIVTTLGGVLIYYITKEPSVNKKEVLHYSISEGAGFRGGNTNVGLNVARIANDGGLAANQVSLVIEYPSATVSDYSIESTSGQKPKTVQIDKQRAEFIFETLLPSESVNINLLTSAPDSPVLHLRSSASMGESFQPNTTIQSPSVNNFAEILVPIVGACTAVITFVFGFLINRQRKGRLPDTEYNSCKNNNGFVLLHQGFVDEAEKILEDALHSGEDSPYCISNLAVCRALKGQVEEAKRLNMAALSYGVRKHAQGLIVFNNAIINLMEGKVDECFIELDKAMLLSPKRVRGYCEVSTLFSSVRDDPKYIALTTSTK